MKKLLSVMLSLVMILSLLPAGLFYITVRAEAPAGMVTATHLTEVPDGYIGIYTKADLDAVRNDLAGNYILMSDIEFADADFAEGGDFYNGGQKWLPIGSDADNAFTGIFDGNGYVIKNMQIEIVSSDTHIYVGVFGYNKGTVKNLGMVDGSVSASCSAWYAYVGGIAGYVAVDGVVTNCYNTGSVSATSTSHPAYAGGIVGSVSGDGGVKNCYNTGAVMSSTVSNRSYAGGIAGRNYSAIVSCYSVGVVKATATDSSTYPGGIVGYNSSSGSVEYCYYGELIAKGVGYGTDTATFCLSDELKIQDTFVGFDFDAVWAFDETLETHPFPVLKNVLHVESEIEAGGNTSEFAGGHGTAYSPYLISDKMHLNNVRNYLDAYYKLLCDIEFTDADFAEDGDYYNDGIGWTPIGDNTNAFTGVFDGNGFSVKNLKLGIESRDGDIYAGLFGYNQGAIYDFGMVGGDISATSSKSSYRAYAGGIAGYNEGVIKNCYNTGSVSASSYAGGIAGHNEGVITDCHNTGNVSASSYAGGITGRNYGTITNCYNTGNVSAFGYAGGIAAYNRDYGTITNCYNTGGVSATATKITSAYNNAYAGGIAGLNSGGTIANCYNTGGVSASRYAGGIAGCNSNNGTVTNCYNTGGVMAVKFDYSAYAGGVVGDNGGNGTVTNCYNIGIVSASDRAGGIVGYNFQGFITNCYYADVTENGVGYGNHTTVKCTIDQLKRQDTFVGFDFDTVWTFDKTLKTHPFPVLVGLSHLEFDNEENTTEFAGGYGTFNSPYLISSKEHLSNARRYLGGHFKLLNNITFTDADFAEGGAFYNGGAGWLPIGDETNAFTGVFDGNGFIIEKLQSNSSHTHVGLFGYNTGTVKNLGMGGGSIFTNITDSLVHSAYAGGVVGYNYGTIMNCYNTGSVSARLAASSCVVYVGGIAGWNFGTITNCYTTGYVTGIDDCFIYAGGIAGYNSGTIKNCYNTGGVARTGLSRSGKTYVGGIAGDFDVSGTIQSCYYACYISKGVGSGTDTAVPCTLEEMQQKDTFAGFDFDLVWTFDETLIAHTFPVLRNILHFEQENTSEFAGGYGTEEAPYLIETKEQLNNVRRYPGACFKLLCDIVFTEDDFAVGGDFYNGGAGWLPIGGDETFFGGGFDGDGHVIKNLQVKIAAQKTDVYAGLFGQNQGVIYNLGLVGGSVSATLTGNGEYFVYAGGIAGENAGVILNCYNTGSVTATTDYTAFVGGIVGENTAGIVMNCYNTGIVSSSFAAGGIVGSNYLGTIMNSYNTGIVAGTSFAGGIVAGSDGYYDFGDEPEILGSVINCYNTGGVSTTATTSSGGGIVGYNYCTVIMSCYNTGSVTVPASENAYAGGIAGANEEGYIADCYFIDSIEKGAGGNYDGEDLSRKCTKDELKQQNTFAEFDFESVWYMDDSGYAFPQLIDNPHCKYTSITSLIHTVTDNTISKITAGTTVSELLGGLSGGEYCKVFKGDTEVNGDDAIGTGMVVKIMDRNTVKAEYTVIVTGDINGDGGISVTDMIAMKSHLLGKTTLSGVYAEAANTNGDSGISITDFIQMKSKLLGKSDITAR